MTNQNFTADTPDKEIALHLKDYHCYGFSDRRSLKNDEFIEEHFPDLVRNLQDRDCGNQTEDSRKEIEKINRKIKSVLNFCEENGLPIARVFERNEDGDAEWRICKPTIEQITYLAFNRWYRMIEGLTNKSLLQANMIEEKSLDVVLEEIKETILDGQVIRVKKKKKKKEIEAQ